MSFRADDLHPMRFLRAVPGSDLIVQQAVRRDPQGLLRSPTLDAITGKVVELYNAELGRIPFEKRPSTMDVVTKTVSTLAHIANFASAGRNSFILPAEVTALLGRTDLGDIRLSDIRLPFRAFYLGFAGGLSVGLPGPPNMIDGAYVETFSIDDDAGPQGYLTFYVTARHTDSPTRAKSAWIVGPEPHFYAPLKILANAQDTLEAAIDRATRSSDIALEAEPEAQAALIEGIQQAAKDGFLVEEPVTTGFERAECRGLANDAQRAGAPLQRHLPAIGRTRGFKPRLADRSASVARRHRLARVHPQASPNRDGTIGRQGLLLGPDHNSAVDRAGHR